MMEEGIGKKIGWGIVAAFAILVVVVGIIGTLYLSVYIYTIILGTIFQVTNGPNATLPVTDATQEFLNTTEASFFTTTGNVLTGAEFAGALITVVVILLVFAGLIVGGYYGYKQFKGKKGEKGGDLGY